MIEGFPDALDRSLLHVFVFGADKGEALAIALPDRGWVLVDGCKLDVDGEELFPALEAFTELRSGTDDDVELLVWTHPHADHYQGILEAIERHRPRRVGMTLVEAPAPGSASKELEALGTHHHLPADLRLQDVFSRVRSTLERVFFYWREEPTARLLLSSQTTPITLGATSVIAFSPDPGALRAFYAQGIPGLRTALKEKANEYSVVLGLEFGSTRIVLGGDLPVETPNGAQIPHGWSRVEASAPQLASHGAYKVSHHGSVAAIPSSFLGGARSREWLVTPFAPQHLPLPTDDEKGGLRVLLTGVSAVRLTSSVGLVTPASAGADVPRDELRAALERVREGTFGRGLRAPAAVTSFDFAWGIALDITGSVRRLFAGRQALTVVETLATPARA